MRKESIATALLIVTLALLALATNQSTAVCPEARHIRPCTCDDEGLQCLKMNNTGLARVFQAPAERKAIRRVWIFQTNLTALPAKAFGDYIIRDLYLDLNHIASIESGAFGDATKTLQSLSLTRNSLTSFPFGDLSAMKKLKQLGLGHNQLTSIHSRAFPPSETLESVDLSHNNIRDIEPGSFSDLYGVSFIDLARNSLEEIKTNALMVKSSSRHMGISLRSNKISKISMSPFGDHHPLTIDLSRNKLTYLDEYAFGPLVMNDTIIDVDDNPFSCSGCEAYKWLINLDKEFQENIENFACTDDTKLEDLTLEMIGCTNQDTESTSSSETV